MLLSAACVPAQSGGSIAAKPTESAGSAAAKPTESAGSAAARPTESAGSTAAKPAESATRRVVFAVPQPMVESNEPRNIGQTYMWQLTPMYEYLIGLDAETGKFVPQLATEWKVEGDQAIRFKLRKGVQFHNGNGEFTAKDVVHSWKDLVRDDATAGYQVVLGKKAIEDVEIVNDYEVLVKIKQKDADLINMISQAQGGFEIMSKADWDKRGDPTLTDAPIAGTGPYQFVSRTQGVNVVYQRVPYTHWRINPEFQEFEFRWMPEASTRLAALYAGEIHVTTLPDDLLPQAEQRGFKIVRGKVPALRVFLNFKCCFLTWPEHRVSDGTYKYPDSPLMELRVRKALNKAIDRDALNKAFFGGKGELIYGFNHVSSAFPGFNPAWKERFPSEYGYDVSAARQLLADAGHGPSNPLKTSLWINPPSSVASAQDMLEAIAGYWRAVGVDVESVQMDSTRRQQLNTQCAFGNDLDLTTTSGAPIVAYGFYNSSFIGNCGGYQHPDTDASFRKIQQELDTEKHADYWRELGDQSFDLHSNIPLFWLPAEAVIAPSVVSDYPWPASISGTWTHVENLKAAR
jgi:peptide/nickel transport system substrate-binding protein